MQYTLLVNFSLVFKENNSVRSFTILGKEGFKGCVWYILANSFLSMKESACETRKNVFISLQKLFTVLKKIKFLNFRYSNFMTLSNGQALNKKYILLNNFRSKHSLLMKLGQFVSYYKEKTLSKNSIKTST